MDALLQTSMRPIEPMGGYFLMADCSKIRGNEPFSVCVVLEHQHSNINTRTNQHSNIKQVPAKSDIATEQYDWKLCEWLTKEVGVVAIPASSAFTDSTRKTWSDDDVFVRFAFCKADSDIDNAVAMTYSMGRIGSTALKSPKLLLLSIKHLFFFQSLRLQQQQLNIII